MKALTAPELEELLLDYVYDELDPADRAAFEAALPSAPTIAAEVEAMRRTRAAMGELGPPPGSLDLGDLMGGMSAVFAEADAVAASVAAQQAPKLREAASGVPADASPSGFGAWLARLGRSLGASMMTPAFGAAAVLFLVAGVAVVMSRTGKFPGEDNSAESQSIGSVAPVALAEGAPAAVAAAPVVSDAPSADNVADEKPESEEAVAAAPATAAAAAGEVADFESVAADDGASAEYKGKDRNKNSAGPEEGLVNLAQGKREDSDEASKLRASLDSNGVPTGAAKQERAAADKSKKDMWGATSGADADDMAVVAEVDGVASDRKFAPPPSNYAAPPVVTHGNTESSSKSDTATVVAESTADRAPPVAPRPQKALAKPTSVPAAEPRPNEPDAPNEPSTRRALEDQVAPARPAQTRVSTTSDGDNRGGAAPREADDLADRREGAASETAGDRRARENTIKIDDLWADLKRQREAGDLAAAEKTLASLQALGADAGRIKAAKAEVAELKRQKAAATKSAPADATRTMK